MKFFCSDIIQCPLLLLLLVLKILLLKKWHVKTDRISQRSIFFLGFIQYTAFPTYHQGCHATFTLLVISKISMYIFWNCLTSANNLVKII